MTMPGSLIVVRHGQSVTNAVGVFTGWLDVELTGLGRQEAMAAGRCLVAAGVCPQAVHTSLFQRAILSAELLVQAMRCPSPNIFHSDALNERHYGALTGRRKAEVLVEAGRVRYGAWRNSLHVAPPPLSKAGLAAIRRRWPADLLVGATIATESVGDVLARVAQYWNDVLAPQIADGETVLIVAHGNSLRALLAYLDALSEDELAALRLSTGAVLRYRFAENLSPLRRGGETLR